MLYIVNLPVQWLACVNVNFVDFYLLGEREGDVIMLLLSCCLTGLFSSFESRHEKTLLFAYMRKKGAE